MTENDNKLNILMKCEIFRDLPEDALDAIARAVQYQVASEHTIISREGGISIPSTDDPATTPVANHSATLAALTPPVGIMGI